MDTSENIVFVDPASSGKKYDAAARKLGLKPLALMTRRIYPEEFEHLVDAGSYDEILYHTSLSDTLDQLKRRNVQAIIAAGQPALVLVDRLAEKLGLVGNPASSHETRIDKALMKKALKEKGIKCADYLLCQDPQTALAWAEKKGFPVVVKPTRGLGSIQVGICSNANELLDAIQRIRALDPFFSGKSDEFLLEEFLEGTEYFMNLVSYGDKKRELISFAEYEKIQIDGHPNICRNIFSLPLDGEFARTAFDYVDSVNTALEVDYGINDVELKIARNGPVFIELNNRLPGANVPSLIERCSSFNCYEENINIFRGRKLERKESTFTVHYCICCLINEHSGVVRELSGLEKLKKLSSFHGMDGIAAAGQYLPQTIDFASVAGFVYLIHEDPQVLRDDAELVHQLVKITTTNE